MGRSGDIMEGQPKAIGSSVLVQVTTGLVLDVLRRGCGLSGAAMSPTNSRTAKPKKKKNSNRTTTTSTDDDTTYSRTIDDTARANIITTAHSGSGGGPARFGLVLPLCTGMSMSLVLSSLREYQSKQPQPQPQPQQAHPTQTSFRRDIVLWCRIDQKSCLKAISSAGFTCIVVPTRVDGDHVVVDLIQLDTLLRKYQCNYTNMDDDASTAATTTPSATTTATATATTTTTHPNSITSRVMAVISTTSCFAPRVPDPVDAIAKLCQQYNVAHLINHAYGLQCKTTCQLINRACVVGRVDALICSMDKNFLVPVGA